MPDTKPQEPQESLVGENPEAVIFDPLNTRRKPTLLTKTPNRTYIAGVIATDLTSMTDPIKGAPDFLGTINGHSVVNDIWNFVDGFCNLATVGQLCMDEDTYHPAKKLKIGLNLIAGIGLIAFTDNARMNALAGIAGCNHFAAPVFALATLCDLLSAALDYYYSTEKGFLEAMIGKVEFLQNRIKKLSSDDARVARFQAEKKDLLEKIKSVCRVYYQKEEDYQQFVDGQLSRLDNILREDVHEPEIVFNDFKIAPSDDDTKLHAQVENSRKKIHKANTIKLMTKSLSFAGMLTQCLPTILLFAGATSWCPIASLAITITSLLLITLVACAYAYEEYQNQQKTPIPDSPKPLRRPIIGIFERREEEIKKGHLPNSHPSPMLRNIL